MMLALVLLSLVQVSLGNTEWKEGIDFVALPEGKQQAQETGKPLMLIMTKTWCGACKNLKKTFTQDAAGRAEFQKLAKSFVVVHTEDDEEPSGSTYAPDGGYIPRIMFFDADHKEVAEGKSGNAQYGYFFPSVSALNGAMTKVLAATGTAKTEL